MRRIEEVEFRMHDIENHIQVYKDYRQVCLENNDHHGVQDASSDLRELEAKIEVLKWVLE